MTLCVVITCRHCRIGQKPEVQFSSLPAVLDFVVANLGVRQIKSRQKRRYILLRRAQVILEYYISY